MEFNNHRSGMCKPKANLLINGEIPFDSCMEYRYAPHARMGAVEVRGNEGGRIYFKESEFLKQFTITKEGWGN